MFCNFEELETSQVHPNISQRVPGPVPVVVEDPVVEFSRRRIRPADIVMPRREYVRTIVIPPASSLVESTLVDVRPIVRGKRHVVVVGEVVGKYQAALIASYMQSVSVRGGSEHKVVVPNGLDGVCPVLKCDGHIMVSYNIKQKLYIDT